MRSPDPVAVQILMKTYWTPKGWRAERSISPEDFAYAKAAGVMFDAAHITHDDAVARAVTLISKTSIANVSAAFLASLSSRRLDLRSALGSYAVGRHLFIHKLQRGRGKTGACAECGEYNSAAPQDLSVLNFERLKWGGVRHLQPIYIGFDLARFDELGQLVPTPRDAEILRQIIHIAASLPAGAKLADLERALASTLTSNSAERRTLIQILGYAGILQPRSHSGFFDAFTRSDCRTYPPAPKNDWTFPVSWWRGSDGVSREAVTFWFPSLFSAH